MRSLLACFTLLLCGCGEKSTPAVAFQKSNSTGDTVYFFGAEGKLCTESFTATGGLETLRVRLYKITEGEIEEVAQSTFKKQFADEVSTFSGRIHLLSLQESSPNTEDVEADESEVTEVGPSRVTLFGVSEGKASCENEGSEVSVPPGYRRRLWSSCAAYIDPPYGEETMILQEHWKIPDPNAQEPPLVIDANYNIISGLEDAPWDIEKLTSISKEKGRIIFYVTVEPRGFIFDCPEIDCP